MYGSQWRNEANGVMKAVMSNQRMYVIYRRNVMWRNGAICMVGVSVMAYRENGYQRKRKQRMAWCEKQ